MLLFGLIDCVVELLHRLHLRSIERVLSHVPPHWRRLQRILHSPKVNFKSVLRGACFIGYTRSSPGRSLKRWMGERRSERGLTTTRLTSRPQKACIPWRVFDRGPIHMALSAPDYQIATFPYRSR